MATWIWYPHDFEIDLRGKVEAKRNAFGMIAPSIWRMDAPTRAVAFFKTYMLEKPGKMRLHWQGVGYPYVFLDGNVANDRADVLDLPAGTHTLEIQLMRLDGLPALYADGDVTTDGTWLVCCNNKDRIPCGTNALFDSPEKRPDTYALPTRRVEKKAILDDGVIDFGRESFGFVHMKGTEKGEFLAHFGESIPEVLAGKRGEIWEYGAFAEAGEEVRLPSCALRYLKVIGPVDPDSVWLEEEYNGLPYRAAFKSDDARLNAIYDTSAYTMELCTREFFLDGIKRDRWVWAGDALQSVMMNHYSYFDSDTSRRTLTALRGREPFDQHINTILDYTFYWMISIWEDYFHTGDASYIAGMYDKMASAMAYTRRFCSADGFVIGQPRDWVFVDWADMSKEGELCIESVLLWKALTILADCAKLLGKAEEAAQYALDAETLRGSIFRVFWSEEKGTLLHQRVNGVVQGHTRYAPMFALMYGMLDEQQTASVIANSLLGGDAPVITTPYMRFYEMDALMRAGRHEEVLSAVRDYWGGMLDLGATSIWEQFDPNQTGLDHYEMYGRPFGRSLCHCWGAGPIYLCGRHLLGVRPTQAGYAQFVVEPHTGGLGCFEGTVPTPSGDICVKVCGDVAEVESACAGEGVLIWKGQRVDIAPCTGETPSSVRLDGGQLPHKGEA